MAITAVHATSWAFGEKLTAAQMNAFDDKIVTALDKTSAGDTLAGAITLSGAGRFLKVIASGADANTTYTIGSFNDLRVSTLTANREYTFSNTGAASGDEIDVYIDASVAYNIAVKDNGGTTIFTLGNGATDDGTAVRLVYNSGWKVKDSRGTRHKSQLFTANGTWTCPANVTRVWVQAIGGGGGGGGGGAGDTGGSTLDGEGGDGGTGAVAYARYVTVTPTTVYTVTVGAAGTAGAAGVGDSANGGNGGTGGTSSFDTLMVCPGGAGGTGGTGGGNGSGVAGTTQPGGGAAGSASNGGAGGGSSWPGGVGGNGGTAGSGGGGGTNGGAGTAGVFGAGGGGGGQGNGDNGGGEPRTDGGAGGAGGQGYVLVMWSI
jgi:hypothetical protein